MKKKFDQFEIEAKTSGGAVFELGVKTSRHDKALRRLAQPDGQILEEHRTKCDHTSQSVQGSRIFA